MEDLEEEESELSSEDDEEMDYEDILDGAAANVEQAANEEQDSIITQYSSRISIICHLHTFSYRCL